MTTISDVLDLALIIEAARHGKRVAWLAGDHITGGIVRRIATADGYVFSSDRDLDDAYLEITTQAAEPMLIPIPRVRAMMVRGEIAFT